MGRLDVRQRLVQHVHTLERLEAEKQAAAEALKAAFDVAKAQGYDTTTLKVVLKLRKMTPSQRQERRVLETLYMAALGILDGDALPDSVRRRLSGEDEPKKTGDTKQPDIPELDKVTREMQPQPPAPPVPEQPPLIQKDPAEAKAEGAAAAKEGKRIYDNPYPAGDPCRAAWDEGWCGQSKSHGMDVPQAYQRRESAKPSKKDDDKDRGGDADGKAA
jgi:uncharacterized protein (UPF0335 family)